VSLPVGCANQREDNNKTSTDFWFIVGLLLRPENNYLFNCFLFSVAIVRGVFIRSDASATPCASEIPFLHLKTTTTSKNNNNNKKEQQQATTTATTTVAASIAIVVATLRDTVGSSRYPVP
jgi:hypothetical protein